MWDWLKALWDGGFTGLLSVASLGVVFCVLREYFRNDTLRERDYWLACAVAFACFALWPMLDLLRSAFQDYPQLQRLGEEPSALTPGKALVLDAIGAVAGRIGYAVLSAFAPVRP